MQVLGNLVNDDSGLQLIRLVIKNFRAQFVAIAIAHTQVIINFHFHFCDFSIIEYRFLKFETLNLESNLSACRVKFETLNLGNVIIDEDIVINDCIRNKIFF